MAVDGGAVSAAAPLGGPMNTPADLGADAQARWDAVYKTLAERGDVDADLLKTYCQVWVRWRQAEDGIAKAGQLVKNAKGRVVQSPLVGLARDGAREVRALERRLGLDAGSDNDLVTRRDLAPLMNVHMQTVVKWEQQGMPIAKRGRAGKPSLYRVADVRAWLDSREEAAQRTGLVDVAQERANKERAQARLAEQTFQMRQRDLLPRAEVEKVWAAEQAAVRTKLLAIPQAYADRVFRAGTLDGVGGVEQALKEAVYEALRELADEDRPPQPPDVTDGAQQVAA